MLISVYSFIHLFDKYLLNSYSETGTVQDTGGTIGNVTEEAPALRSFCSSRETVLVGQQLCGPYSVRSRVRTCPETSQRDASVCAQLAAGDSALGHM